MITEAQCALTAMESKKSKNNQIYKDCNGNKISNGTRFIYGMGTSWEAIGHVLMEDEELWLYFHDRVYAVKMSDFWYPETDEKITKVIKERD